MTEASSPQPPKTRSRNRFVVPLICLACLAVISFPTLRDVALRALGKSPTPSTIAWRADFDAARAEARAAGRPVLIDFTASWCPPCRTMERDTWPDDAVEARVKQVVIPLKLDVDLPAVQPIAQRYGVEAIPTVLLVDADGTVLRRGAFMTAAEVLTFLDARTE